MNDEKKVPTVPVLLDEEVLHQEALRVVVRTDRVLQRAGRNKTALRDVTLTDDKLPCIGRYRIRVSIKVAVDRVHLYALIDIARYGTVIIALLCQVLVIVESRLVTQNKGTLHVLLNGILVRRNGKEQLKSPTCKSD